MFYSPFLCEKCGFGCTFLKAERKELKSEVHKMRKKVRNSVKIKYYIFKFRNISLPYAQVLVLR
jgi:radical SAM superfamily enzyme